MSFDSRWKCLEFGFLSSIFVIRKQGEVAERAKARNEQGREQERVIVSGFVDGIAKFVSGGLNAAE